MTLVVAIGSTVTFGALSGVAAGAVGGTMLGAGLGAITGAATGQGAGKGALMGAITGGIGGGAAPLVSAAGAAGGTAAQVGAGALTGAAANAAGAAAGGKPIGEAALLGGVTGGALGGINANTGPSTGAQLAEGAALPGVPVTQEAVNKAAGEIAAETGIPQQTLTNVPPSAAADSGFFGNIGSTLDKMPMSQIAKNVATFGGAGLGQYMLDKGHQAEQATGAEQASIGAQNAAATGIAPQVSGVYQGSGSTPTNPLGGLGGIGYAKGGQIPLKDGAYIIPADVVSALGNGSSKAGADFLRRLLAEVRREAIKRQGVGAARKHVA